MGADETKVVASGDKFTWEGLAFEVLGVSRKYALILVRDSSSGTSWTKRQPLPFPDTFKRVTA